MIVDVLDSHWNLLTAGRVVNTLIEWINKSNDSVEESLNWCPGPDRQYPQGCVVLEGDPLAAWCSLGPGAALWHLHVPLQAAPKETPVDPSDYMYPGCANYSLLKRLLERPGSSLFLAWCEALKGDIGRRPAAWLRPMCWAASGICHHIQGVLAIAFIHNILWPFWSSCVKLLCHLDW